MGTQFGAVADAIADQLGSSGLKDFFANMEAGINAATPGLAAFAAAFTRIMEQGSTLFPMFGEWIAKIGEGFNNWAQNADIAGLIEEAAVQMGHLFDVGKELWGIISGIFNAMDTGKSTGLESMAATLGVISDIVNGPTFQTALGLIFEGAASGAAALSDALVPIGNALALLAPTIAMLLDTLGGTAGAVFTGIAEALAAPVAQGGLQTAIEAVSNLLIGIDWGAFSGIIGGLGSVIGALAPGVMELVNAFLPLVTSIFPLLAQVAGVLAGIIPVLVASFQPLVETLVAGLMPVIAALMPAFEALVPAIVTIVAALAESLVPVFASLPPLIEALTP